MVKSFNGFAVSAFFIVRDASTERSRRSGVIERLCCVGFFAVYHNATDTDTRSEHDGMWAIMSPMSHGNVDSNACFDGPCMRTRRFTDWKRSVVNEGMLPSRMVRKS